jgi:hypothetical protein
MAKKRPSQPRTATAKQASAVTRARAEQESRDGLVERTEEGHRKAGREPSAEAAQAVIDAHEAQAAATRAEK